MPVQDNENKRTAEPAADTEEERRKQQAKAQEHENSVQKSGKLLPFLNAKAEHHQNRIETIDEKIATKQDKVAKNEAKIEKLSAKADRLEDKNKMLKAMLGNFPGIGKMIESNEKKIKEIREEKIPKRQNKVEKHTDRISQLSEKRNLISHKLNRVLALNDTIKSFSIGLNQERREAFADAMDRLNEAAYNCLSDKKKSLSAKKDSIVEKYNAPETNSVDKYKLQQQINDLNDRIQAVDERIEKVWQPDEFYSMQSDDTLDAQMKLTSDKLADAADSNTVTMPELAENTLFYASETEELDKSQVAEIADKFNNMAKVEEQLEDDYNMIDGIINNGSKDDIDKAKAELSKGIKSVESLAENPFVSEEIRANAAEELTKMKKQLEMLDMSDEVEAEGWLTNMVDEGKAEFTDDGGFKINPDYYKELPRNDRHIETMTEAQATVVMSAMTAKNIAFSAASRGEDNVKITVSKSDMATLNEIMQRSIGKSVHHTKKQEQYQTVNPDYYKSLPKDQRFTRVEAKDTAREIVKGLQQQNIPYSAVVRKNDTVAITVSTENAQAYKQIESTVKGERAVQFVNSEFFKLLPKQERFTQRMDEALARTKSAELSAKGVEHSAVMNGEKSAVTVAKKDSRRAFFSRSNMQRDARRISGRGEKQPQQTTKKRDNQELGE